MAQGWLAEREQNLNEAEASYIRQSQEMQLRVQKERQRRRQWTFTGLAIGLVLAVAMAGWRYTSARMPYSRVKTHCMNANALRQAAILLSGQAEKRLTNGYHDRAVLLALAAIEDFPYTPQAEHALGQAVSYSHAQLIYSEHQSAVTSVAGRQMESA